MRYSTKELLTDIEPTIDLFYKRLRAKIKFREHSDKTKRWIMPKDLYQIKRLLTIKNGTFFYFSLEELSKQGFAINKLLFSIRILLENALRNSEGFGITKEHIETIVRWSPLYRIQPIFHFRD